jgi:hypothetical protein
MATAPVWDLANGFHLVHADGRSVFRMATAPAIVIDFRDWLGSGLSGPQAPGFT